MIEQLLTPDDFGHGLGPGIQADIGFFGHGGANEGFRCNLTAQLDGGQGLVVMTNSDSGGTLAREILLSVAREYGWDGIGPTVKQDQL